MALFGNKQPETPGLIGIDFGGDGVKLVELLPANKRVKLGSYAYSERKEEKEGEEAKPLLDTPELTGALMKKLMEEAGMHSKKANASLPSHEIFHAIISIPQPKSAKEDIRPMIETQVKKFLPIPIEEMVLDTVIIDKDLLPKKEDDAKKKGAIEAQVEVESKEDIMGKHVRVLVSGASRELVAKYIAVCKQADLELIALETEAFALIRSMIGKDQARMLILDIGYERTNITVVQEGVPFLHRSIQAGGKMVTEMIASQMGIDDESAEQAKLDLALSQDQDGALPKILKQSMIPIVHEVKYSIELYKQQGTVGAGIIDKIIITGGSAHLPGIRHFLEEALNINVYIGDPWARVLYPEPLKPVLDEIGARFSVAIGLAMKDIET